MAQQVFTKKKAASAPPPSPAPSPAHRQKPEAKSESRHADKAPRYEDLPLVSVFDKKDMKHSIDLMYESIEIQQQEKALAARKAEIKDLLVAIAQRHKVEGMRHGRIAVYYNGEKTRRTLDRGLLIENGVTPQQIEDSMKESKPFVDLRVVDLDKGKDDAD
jgi:hypothetical protein